LAGESPLGTGGLHGRIPVPMQTVPADGVNVSAMLALVNCCRTEHGGRAEGEEFQWIVPENMESQAGYFLEHAQQWLVQPGAEQIPTFFQLGTLPSRSLLDGVTRMHRMGE
jgi:hypothetical protein